MRPLVIDITRSILVLWEERMVAIRIHVDWPVNEVEVDIVEAQSLQTLINSFLDLGVIGVPELGGDKNVLTLSSVRPSLSNVVDATLGVP